MEILALTRLRSVCFSTVMRGGWKTVEVGVCVLAMTVGLAALAVAKGASHSRTGPHPEPASCHHKGERVARHSGVAALLAPPPHAYDYGNYYACWKPSGQLTRIDTESLLNGEDEFSPYVYLLRTVGRWVGLVSQHALPGGFEDTIVTADARSQNVYRPPLPRRTRDSHGVPIYFKVTGLALNRCGTTAYAYTVHHGNTAAAHVSRARVVVWRPGHARAVRLFEGHYDRGTLSINLRRVSWRSHHHRHQRGIPWKPCT